MLCAIIGHRWRTIRVHTPRWLALAHLHPMAGLDAVCERCRAHWLDAEPMVDMLGHAVCRECGRPESEPCSA